MSSLDIRWIQRFDNFKRAFARLSEASDLAEQRGFSDLERQGLIQAFEFTDGVFDPSGATRPHSPGGLGSL